jgi:Protein of unknown function (DUF1592)/Protein of unknown function (DUF1588)/Protein of unknown function (DUF1587)/Protein of unknown function (DUF1585)/Protein of unknown function (DUF1595)/Planctomycete cytochrome C
MRETRFSLFLLVIFAGPAAANPTAAELDRQLTGIIQPFLQNYCLGCHGSQKPKGDLDLSSYRSIDSVARDLHRWETVVSQLHGEMMPPIKAKAQPTAEARREVIAWVKGVRRLEGKRTAGDPGPVPARRLSNAEYDYSIRDLTGVDIRPAREFPVDPANEAGFDNSGESLAMSPALVKKYLEAARRVADHLVLKPEGFSFADHLMVADTDRDKYCVRRIIDFYRRQPVDLVEYFQAAWRYQHRAELGKQNATLAEVSTDSKVSAKYLTTLWDTLTGKADEVGPIAALQAMWKELPDAKQPAAARAGCVRMNNFVSRVRQQLVPDVKNLTAPGIISGSQCFVLWKNRQFAANRRRYAGGARRLTNTGLPSDSSAAKAMTIPTDKAATEKYEATFQRFCSTFPDAFYVSERARVYLDPAEEKKLTGRLLSAGFHSMTGYFRDDGPLYDLILDADGQKELDRLWREFDFITGAPMRQHTSFLWFERTDSAWLRDPEFDAFRAEDKDSTSDEKIRKLAEVYLNKAKRRGASDVALDAIAVHFKTISAQIRAVERDRVAAEPSHLAALQTLAEQAYRRPLTNAEHEGVVSFYRGLRDKEGLSHEDAVRDSVVGILMSPHFCYHVEAASGRGANGTEPLSDYAIAGRLSYFLWSSIPDAELLARAAAGDLHKPDVIVAQAKRMLLDPKAGGLATEFAGNWLEFRRFDQHNSVDRSRFPAFTDELRQAMFEEPVRFFQDVAARDASILDFLDANHTFVNPVLARHYGMPAPKDWARIDDANKYGRGGLLPMAVFMTGNSPGLRTSPVKRGYWVVRRLLGETIPPPPSTVPELPADEAKFGERTLRETLAKHRDHPSCAGCHNRFDSIGLVFEGYGPVGERREKDLAGHPVDTRAAFPGGGDGTGLDGLRTYLRDRRQAELVDNLCRKLLAYGLGRTLLPGDDDTIEEMKVRLAANGHRFGMMVEAIVTSRQFRCRRAE